MLPEYYQSHLIHIKVHDQLLSTLYPLKWQMETPFLIIIIVLVLVILIILLIIRNRKDEKDFESDLKKDRSEPLVHDTDMGEKERL